MKVKNKVERKVFKEKTERVEKDYIQEIENLKSNLEKEIQITEDEIQEKRDKLSKLKQALSAFSQAKDRLKGVEPIIKSKSTRIVGLAESILQAIKCTDKVYTPSQMAKEIEHSVRLRGWPYTNYTSYKASVTSTLMRLSKQGKIGQTPNTEAGKGFKFYRLEEKKNLAPVL